MKALFNARCDHCLTFLPRCARVRIRARNINNASPAFCSGRGWVNMTMCEGCRREHRGKYRPDDRHK